MSGTRYAIYFVPHADSDLYRFGSAVLGHDCYSGRPVRHPDFVPGGWAHLTREPRIYGFHATLKAPFRLLPEIGEDDVMRELKRFAGNVRQLQALELQVTDLNGFVALTPRENIAALAQLAGKCVENFERLRAPLTQEELRRRKKAVLTARQEKSLQRWGYPYVFEDFAFHMTLTGSILSDRRATIVEMLGRGFRSMCDTNILRVDQVALVRQDSPRQHFRVVSVAAISSSGAKAG